MDNLPNVKREKKLPVILSKEEIERLISATKNMNHRLIIQVGYSAGLRISEIINLRWQDIIKKRILVLFFIVFLLMFYRYCAFKLNNKTLYIK